MKLTDAIKTVLENKNEMNQKNESAYKLISAFDMMAPMFQKWGVPEIAGALAQSGESLNAEEDILSVKYLGNLRNKPAVAIFEITYRDEESDVRVGMGYSVARGKVYVSIDRLGMFKAEF